MPQLALVCLLCSVGSSSIFCLLSNFLTQQLYLRFTYDPVLFGCLDIPYVCGLPHAEEIQIKNNTAVTTVVADSRANGCQGDDQFPSNIHRALPRWLDTVLKGYAPQKQIPGIKLSSVFSFILCVCVVVSSTLVADLHRSVCVGPPAGVTHDKRQHRSLFIVHNNFLLLLSSVDIISRCLYTWCHSFFILSFFLNFPTTLFLTHVIMLATYPSFTLTPDFSFFIHIL